jgi:hypothetical protein
MRKWWWVLLLFRGLMGEGSLFLKVWPWTCLFEISCFQRLLRWQTANVIEHWTLLVTISCLECGDCTQLPNHIMHTQSIMALFLNTLLFFAIKGVLFSHLWRGCMDLELQVLAWWLNLGIWKVWKLHKFPCHYWSSVRFTNEMWHYESSSNNWFKCVNFVKVKCTLNFGIWW